jgi:rhodanese-related sulfurtransferase
MNSPSILTGVCLALSLGLGCARSAAPATAATTAPAAASASSEAELRPVTVEELAGYIARNEVAVIDNNGQERYARGHIPGARWVGHDQVTAEVLPADRAARVVFYCHNEQCTACHTAARQAIGLGYTNVFILPAGIVGWSAAGKPVVAGNNPT